jgi:hypothetical protein
MFVLGGSAFDPIGQHWDEIVEQYMDTVLTRPEDKLVTISGLAKQVLEDYDDIYCAGLWRNDFARNLLWYLVTPQRKVCTKYRAPSWSWASVDGRVAHLARRLITCSTVAASKLGTIQTLGTDGQRCSTGQIKDGFCRISGPLRECLRYEKQGNTHRLVLTEELSNYCEYVDFFQDTIVEEMPSISLACLSSIIEKGGEIARIMTVDHISRAW